MVTAFVVMLGGHVAQIESSLAGGGDQSDKQAGTVTACEAEAARRAATTARVRDELNALERRVDELLRAASAATVSGSCVRACAARECVCVRESERECVCVRVCMCR